MARLQFKVTFTNAQPGAPVEILTPSTDHVYPSSTSVNPVGGKQLYLDGSNSIIVWSDAQAVIAQTLDGTGSFIQGTATVGSPTIAVGDGTAPTNPPGSAAYARAGRRATSVYDDFSAYGSATINGVTAQVGGAWTTSGAQPPTVTGGGATSTGTGYIGQTLAAKIATMGCEVIFSGSGTANAMTMIASSDASIIVSNAVHFNFGPGGFTLTLRKDGGSFDSCLSGVWRFPMLVDGTTKYRLGLMIHKDTVIVLGPHGETFAQTDPRIELLNGTLPIWEPNTNTGTQATLITAVATTVDTTKVSNPDDVLNGAALAGLVSGPNGQTVGSKGRHSEVWVGVDSATNMPAVTFGPPTIYTRLTSAAASSATSIVTDDYLPSGVSVMLESGTNSETVTTSAASTGTGPYTTTVPALTKSHAAQTSATATNVAGAQTKMYFNTANSQFHLPNVPVVVFDGGKAYLGTQLDTFVERDGTGPCVGFSRPSRSKVYTTAGRPTAASVGPGAQIYDSTLSKPTWSDGTNWRDAAGTIV